jgi:hypothetical protein
MSRKSAKKEPKSRSYKVGAWIGAALSTLLLIPTGEALGSDIISFRSCSINSSGLFVDTCGKENVNSGDLVLVILFLGSLSIVICLITHAYRSSRRTA